MTAARIAGLACAAALVAVGATRAAPSIGGARLVVYWSENPWPSIWAVRADGTQVHRILRNKQNGKRPRLSPDRRWVAFDGAPPGKIPLADFDIQVVHPDGTGLRTVTHGSMWDLDAQWSPDGRWISFTRFPPHATGEHTGYIWIVRPDGSGLRRLGRGFGARWSPDGEKLVCEAPAGQGATSLSVISIAGGAPQVLLLTPGIEQPSGWSPDGKQILFNRYPAAGGAASMYLMNADGSDVRMLGKGIAAAWSPDGTKILYSSSFVSGLLVMNRDGSHRRRIGTVYGSEPDWR